MVNSTHLQIIKNILLQFPSKFVFKCHVTSDQKSKAPQSHMLEAHCLSLCLCQVAGRILWCRQLFRKMDAPMLTLKKKLDALKVRPLL